MGGIVQVLNSPYTFWALLALPSVGMMSGFVFGGASPHDLLHPTGEFAARFMILAMIITPLKMLFSSHRWPLWLVRRRRYLGVAAFGYALLHTIFYIIDQGSFSAILTDAFELSIWTGWIAFLIFVPLALTSNDWAVRKMRQAWKPLQRWVYVAAVFTLGHWIFLEYELGPALVHFLPLIALEAYRIVRQVQQSRKLAAA
ncbi:MAG: sulfite oxidase heme-binding subunit YedZ [Geminicoccales bacterium]